MFNEEALLQELNFKAIRSSGCGGQHINKVSSKVELSFDLGHSVVLSKFHKQRVFLKLQHRLTKEGILIIQCGESRSQHRNKELVIKRFLELIYVSLIIPKKRIPTKIPRSIIQKRLRGKRKISDKKVNRRKPNLD